MSKFYFTYGTEVQPFRGGWTEVEAPSRNIAIGAFELFHPSTEEGLLRCCSVYTEEQFKRTCMSGPDGNFGKFCHEHIVINHKLAKD